MSLLPRVSTRKYTLFSDTASCQSCGRAVEIDPRAGSAALRRSGLAAHARASARYHRPGRPDRDHPHGACPPALAPCLWRRGAEGARHPIAPGTRDAANRSEEHTSELQSLMRISYDVFCLKKKTIETNNNQYA